MCFACLYPKAGRQSYSVAEWDAFKVERKLENKHAIYVLFSRWLHKNGHVSDGDPAEANGIPSSIAVQGIRLR